MSLITLLPILFFISELALLLFRRSKQTEGSKGGDKNSLLLFWVVIPASIMAAIFVAMVTPSVICPALSYAGAAVIIAGLIIRWIAIWQLGKAFTVNVAIASDHHSKTNGLYRIVRHPSYTGLLLVITGLALGMENLYAFFTLTIPIFLAMAYRIHVEEKMLLEAFGEQYEQYKKQTKRLIPWIY